MYKDFTSLPADEEQTFVVFEEHTRAAAKKAWTLALSVGGILFLLTLIVVFSHSKPPNRFEEKEAPAAAKSLGEEKAEKKEAPPAEEPKAEEKPAEGAEGEKPAEGDKPADGEAAKTE